MSNQFLTNYTEVLRLHWHNRRLWRVQYRSLHTSKRPLIPWKPVLDNTPENIREACNEMMLGLLTKDDAWEYENEWRILINASENSELAMPKISCVYLGASIEKENKVKILNTTL